MFRFLNKAFRAYLNLYGEPGTGVTVMSGADSVADFYRMRNVRLPLDAETPARRPRKRAPRASIWGGQGAAHIVSFRTTATCSDC